VYTEDYRRFGIILLVSGMRFGRIYSQEQAYFHGDFTKWAMADVGRICQTISTAAFRQCRPVSSLCCQIPSCLPHFVEIVCSSRARIFAIPPQTFHPDASKAGDRSKGSRGEKGRRASRSQLGGEPTCRAYKDKQRSSHFHSFLGLHCVRLSHSIHNQRPLF
jgi:hypothetical protein